MCIWLSKPKQRHKGCTVHCSVNHRPTFIINDGVAPSHFARLIWDVSQPTAITENLGRLRSLEVVTLITVYSINHTFNQSINQSFIHSILHFPYLMTLVAPFTGFSVEKVERKQRCCVGGNPLDSFDQELNLFVTGEEAQVQSHKTYWIDAVFQSQLLNKNQSINHSNNQSFKHQSFRQWIKPSIIQTINQSINQWQKQDFDTNTRRLIAQY